jgi:factor associated with neutral sphingomyelinase activation
MLWKFSSARRSSAPGALSSALLDEVDDGEEGRSVGQQSRATELMGSGGGPGPAGGVPGGEGVPPSGSGAGEGGGGGGGMMAERMRLLSLHLQRGQEQGRQRSAGSSGGSAWGSGLRDRLHPSRVMVAGSDAANAICLSADNGAPASYSAHHDGSLKVFMLSTGEQLRSTVVGSQPLASLCLLPTGSDGDGGGGGSPQGAAAAAAAALGRGDMGGEGGRHPLVLCGSYDSEIYAYSVDYGRAVGSFSPHEDAVACMDLVPEGGGVEGGLAASDAKLISASWDSSVKVWALGGGRQPWDTTVPQPLAALTNLSGGVWAVAAARGGAPFLIAGTEDGAVVGWDWRAGAAAAWEQAISEDYIGGVSLTPDGRYAVVAAADGTLSLLDLRKGGARLSSVTCDAPLRCCTTDGNVAVAGSEAGAVR